MDALQQIEGAYCLVILTDDKLIAVRDPNGFRPLALGRIDGSYTVASETCAFDIIGAEYIRDVEPGEVTHVSTARRTEKQRAGFAPPGTEKPGPRAVSVFLSMSTFHVPTARFSGRWWTKSGEISESSWPKSIRSMSILKLHPTEKADHHFRSRFEQYGCDRLRA
jgi:hypothetical protein